MTSSKPRQDGFTLVELLVVMLIIGILLSVAVLSIGNSERYRVRNEAYDLQQLLASLHQAAILKNQQFGLRIKPDGYEVLTPDGEKWSVLSDDKLYQAHQLDKDLSYQIDIDTAPGDEEEEGAVIYILSSGEMSPFRLLITTHDQRYQFTLKGDMLGHLSIEKGRADAAQ